MGWGDEHSDVHPDAPAGGGGPGRFRAASGPLGQSEYPKDRHDAQLAALVDGRALLRKMREEIEKQKKEVAIAEAFGLTMHATKILCEATNNLIVTFYPGGYGVLKARELASKAVEKLDYLTTFVKGGPEAVVKKYAEDQAKDVARGIAKGAAWDVAHLGGATVRPVEGLMLVYDATKGFLEAREFIEGMDEANETLAKSLENLDRQIAKIDRLIADLEHRHTQRGAKRVPHPHGRKPPHHRRTPKMVSPPMKLG